MIKYLLILLCSCEARDCAGQPNNDPSHFVPAPRQPVVTDKGMDLSPILPLPSPFRGPGPWGW